MNNNYIFIRNKIVWQDVNQKYGDNFCLS